MDALQAYDGALQIPASMRQSEITIPGVELHHFITDDQLTELSNMRAEPVMEICLASVGAFVGSIIPALEQLSRFNDATDPMGMVGLLTAFLALGSGVSALISGLFWRSRHRRHVNLATVIRSRPKVAVKTASDERSSGLGN